MAEHFTVKHEFDILVACPDSTHVGNDILVTVSRNVVVLQTNAAQRSTSLPSATTTAHQLDSPDCGIRSVKLERIAPCTGATFSVYMYVDGATDSW